MRKVLILAPTVIYPPKDGWRVRHSQLIQSISKDFECDLISFGTRNEVDEIENTKVLRKQTGLNQIIKVPLRRMSKSICSFVGIFKRTPLAVVLYRSSIFQSVLKQQVSKKKYDACLILGDICMAQYASFVNVERVVWDMCDDLPLIFLRKSKHTGNIFRRVYYKNQAELIRSYLGSICDRFDSILVIAEKDSSSIKTLTSKPVVTVPLIVDIEKFRPPERTLHTSPCTALFTGAMKTRSNIEAVTFFTSEILPNLRARKDGLEFHVVGTGSQSLQLSSFDGVVLTDYVSDLAEYYRSCDIYVCPLKTGTGIKNKLLEAMASGCAIVTTSVGAEGLSATHGEDLLIADTASEFASAVDLLVDDPILRRRLSSGARRFAESWVARLSDERSRLKELLQ